MVTDMHHMFYAATAFEQPLDNWNMSDVTNMNSIFRSASSESFRVNQPPNDWIVGRALF